MNYNAIKALRVGKKALAHTALRFYAQNMLRARLDTLDKRATDDGLDLDTLIKHANEDGLNLMRVQGLRNLISIMAGMPPRGESKSTRVMLRF